VRVDFIEYLRSVERFTTVDALLEEIRRDVDHARRVLEADEA
jgi:FAD synthase